MNYSTLMLELERYKNKHPNLTTFWKKYINLKKKAFENSITECSKNVQNIGDIQDVNLTTLFFVYLYQSSIYT